MKMLFVILLIAGGLIYAGNHGAFKHNSVEKSFGTRSDSEKDNQVVLNNPNVSSIEGFTKTNASSGTIKDGSEISIVKGDVKSTSTQIQNDESDPYSAHTDTKDLASLPDIDTSKSNLPPTKDQKPEETSGEPKTLMQQLSQAGSLSEVLTLLKDVVVPKNQGADNNQQSNSDSQTNNSNNNNPGSQPGNTTVPTSPSDQNPAITPPKVEEVKKDSLVIVLPIDSANTQTNTNGNVVTIKSSSTSNALLSICKTQYSNTKDLRIVNQTTAFDLVTKTAQSMTFEVECIR